MQPRKLKLLLVASLILVAAAVQGAEEGGEGAPKASTENKDQKEFSEKTAKLNTLASKVEEANKKFDALVKEKNEARAQSEKQRLVKELSEADKERGKAKVDYDKVKSELALRFPNKGVNSNRNYQLESAKSIKENSKAAATLDELLTRTKKIIDKKFAAFADESKPELDVKKEKDAAEPEQRLRLEK